MLEMSIYNAIWIFDRGLVKIRFVKYHPLQSTWWSYALQKKYVGFNITSLLSYNTVILSRGSPRIAQKAFRLHARHCRPVGKIREYRIIIWEENSLTILCFWCALFSLWIYQLIGVFSPVRVDWWLGRGLVYFPSNHTNFERVWWLWLSFNRNYWWFDMSQTVGSVV